MGDAMIKTSGVHFCSEECRDACVPCDLCLAQRQKRDDDAARGEGRPTLKHKPFGMLMKIDEHFPISGGDERRRILTLIVEDFKTLQDALKLIAAGCDDAPSVAASALSKTTLR